MIIKASLLTCFWRNEQVYERFCGNSQQLFKEPLIESFTTKILKIKSAAFEFTAKI